MSVWTCLFQVSKKSDLRMNLQALVSSGEPDMSTSVIDEININSPDDSGVFATNIWLHLWIVHQCFKCITLLKTSSTLMLTDSISMMFVTLYAVSAVNF